MENIALISVCIAAALYIYRQIAGIVKTDRPSCGCGGGCKGCGAGPETAQRQARADEKPKRPATPSNPQTPNK